MNRFHITYFLSNFVDFLRTIPYITLAGQSYCIYNSYFFRLQTYVCMYIFINNCIIIFMKLSISFLIISNLTME